MIKDPDKRRVYVREKSKELDQKHKQLYGRPYSARNGNLANTFKAARARAKAVGLAFTIKLADIEQPEKCPILGIPLNYFVRGNPEYNSPSLDRIDNSIGYVPGNVQVISMLANTMKNKGTLEQCVLLGKWAAKELRKRARAPSVAT